MKSALPKVLHRLAGRALLLHVLDACAALRAQRTVVVTGYAAEEVERCVAAAVRGLSFPSHPKLDVTRTTF